MSQDGVKFIRRAPPSSSVFYPSTYLLPIPNFQEDTIKVPNLDIEKYLATKSDVFQTGISIIKAFARIDRIDEFNQGDFTIRPLQQLTVYYGGEFKMQFV